jgi:hypothetical protein
MPEHYQFAHVKAEKLAVFSLTSALHRVVENLLIETQGNTDSLDSCKDYYQRGCSNQELFPQRTTTVTAPNPQQ